MNFKHTLDLLDKTASREVRATWAHKINVDMATLQTLIEYADIMRLMYFGKILAMRYHKAGITGVEKLANSDPEDLHKRLVEITSIESWTPPAKKLIN